MRKKISTPLSYLLLFGLACLSRPGLKGNERKEEIANFTLDWDGKILLLVANGEFLIRVDTNLLTQETIVLPQRVFQPKKVLANFSYLFLSNSSHLFILERKNRRFQKVLSFGEINDWTLSPFGEIFLLKRGERNLIRIDQFFNAKNFPSPIDPSSQSLAFFGGELAILNPEKKEILFYNPLGVLLGHLPLPEEDLQFSPSVGEEVYLFSPSGNIWTIKEKVISFCQNLGKIKSCLPGSSSFFILTPEEQIKKIPRDKIRNEK